MSSGHFKVASLLFASCSFARHPTSSMLRPRLFKIPASSGLDCNAMVGKQERERVEGQPAILRIKLTPKRTKETLVGPPGLEPGTNGL